MDLDYVPNEINIASIIKNHGCERKEATVKDYEENWKWKRREFVNQTKCMTSFFSRLLGSYTNRDTKILLIRCVPEIKGRMIITSTGHCDVQVPFDYDYFIDLGDAEKKKNVLETLMKGIRLVAIEKKWDMEPFEGIYERILKADYTNEWIWKKHVMSPNSKYNAHILIRHEIKQVDIFIVVCDAEGNEIVKNKIISEIPNEWTYSEHLGEVKWYDDKVALISKNSEKEWFVSCIGGMD
jgi:hypothetical protein